MEEAECLFASPCRGALNQPWMKQEALLAGMGLGIRAAVLLG